MSEVRVGEVVFGGREVVVMAGPCSVESEEQLMTTARAVADAGARVLRGGAYKPRTSPYEFQGLGEEGLRLLRAAGDQFGLKVITEVLDVRHADTVAAYADILQIGARSMTNSALLREVAGLGKPVLLKRHYAATIEEWLLAAEYLLSSGNDQVLLCERGIRTFETATRFTLDLNAVAVAKEQSHLPVIVDPSHGTGRWSLVPAMAMAGVAAGADGLLIEVHPDPERALSDGMQSLQPVRFAQLMRELGPLAAAVGRSLTLPRAVAATG